MDSKKIMCIIVTYNRIESLKKNIQCLKKQSHKLNKIIIVDNASCDGTYEFMTSMYENDEQIAYFRKEYNSGGSGGFSFGVKKAYNMGADYIWGMDDDAYPEEDALKNIIKAQINLGNKVALWSNCDNNCEVNYKEVRTWMFVGFFINRDIITNVGFPKSDYFIYWDDHEYAQRIIRNGYKIYKVRDSVIIHQDANKNYYDAIHIGPIRFKMYKMPNWKVYYYVRNKILTYGWNNINKYEAILDAIKTIIKCIIYNNKQQNIVLKAMLDGILGKEGKRMEP